MNKKILTITILALVVCLAFAFAFANPVMAADCTGEKCAETCKEEGCDGNCGVNCCPIKMGEKCYPTMQDAINAAQKIEGKTATIQLLGNVSGDGFIIESGNITIDFGTFEYDVNGKLVGSTGTETSGCQILKGANVTFKNGTLKSKTAKFLIQNYANLTIENMKIDASFPKQDAVPYALSNNCGKVNITGNTSITSTNVAFDVYYWAPSYIEGTQVTVDTTGTITGKIEVTSSEGKESESKSELNIKNINHNGELFVNDQLSDKVTVDDGSFKSDVTKYVRNNDAVISVKKGDKLNYYVGTSADKEIENIEPGSTITVTKGDLELENLPNDVTVVNTGDGNVTVNGYVVNEEGVNTTELNKEEPNPAPTEEPSDENSKNLDSSPETGVTSGLACVISVAVLSALGIAVIEKRKVK